MTANWSELTGRVAAVLVQEGHAVPADQPVRIRGGMLFRLQVPRPGATLPGRVENLLDVLRGGGYLARLRLPAVPDWANAGRLIAAER